VIFFLFTNILALFTPSLVAQNYIVPCRNDRAWMSCHELMETLPESSSSKETPIDDSFLWHGENPYFTTLQLTLDSEDSINPLTQPYRLRFINSHLFLGRSEDEKKDENNFRPIKGYGLLPTFVEINSRGDLSLSTGLTEQSLKEDVFYSYDIKSFHYLLNGAGVHFLYQKDQEQYALTLDALGYSFSQLTLLNQSGAYMTFTGKAALGPALEKKAQKEQKGSLAVTFDVEFKAMFPFPVLPVDFGLLLRANAIALSDHLNSDVEALIMFVPIQHMGTGSLAIVAGPRLHLDFSSTEKKASPTFTLGFNYEF
jgi:hypothetical protein